MHWWQFNNLSHHASYCNESYGFTTMNAYNFEQRNNKSSEYFWRLLQQKSKGSTTHSKIQPKLKFMEIIKRGRSHERQKILLYDLVLKYEISSFSIGQRRKMRLDKDKISPVRSVTTLILQAQEWPQVTLIQVFFCRNCNFQGNI